MPTNDFKPFATGAGANVISQADWVALAALVTGFQSGKASSAQINKAIRQASFIAAAMAQYVCDKTGNDVLDNGNVSGFVTQLIDAFSYSPNFTGTPLTPDMDQGNYGQQIANSKFVRDAINVVIGGAPSTLNTLGKLALAIGNDPNFTTAVNQNIANIDNAKMAKAANGSDIADKAAFRSNLNLLSAAQRDVGTGTNQIPDMSSFPLTATQSGWTKLPNGVYLQWGVTPSTTGTISASFPIAFPNACLWLGKNTYSSGSSATSTSIIEIVSPTRTGFTMSNIATIINGNTAVAGPVSGGVAFFAIGY